MFNLLMTYQQVSPAFLEQLFPFGRQHFVEDYHSGGFRDVSHLHRDDAASSIPELSTSGRQITLSYSLKAVESTSESWSVRQCSVYHSFDIETERAIWITVKGDTLIRDLINAHVERTSTNNPSTLRPDNASMSNALGIHVLLAHWSAENWRPYITNLNNQLQTTTRRTLSTSVGRTAREPSEIPFSRSTMLRPATTGFSRKTTKSTMSSMSGYIRKLTGFSTDKDNKAYELPIVEDEKAQQLGEDSEEKFSFEDLQHVQFVEEKAAEALLVLKSNANVYRQLKDAYLACLDNEDTTDSVIVQHRKDIMRFSKTLSNILADTYMQQSRAEALLKLAGERKSLLYGILQYQNMEASRLLAEKAQLSAINMEALTEQMHAIANKTEAETISMRIITVVTLFFLPGTFISTLMSTPIVSFNTDSPGFSAQNIGFGALEFYVVLSIPLMCLTFLSWYAVHWWERRKRERRMEELDKARLSV